jgi:hypothetical protein
MAYVTVPNSFTTATTFLATHANENYAALATGITSGLNNFNVLSVRANVASLDTSIKFGGSEFMKFYYYSHTIATAKANDEYTVVTIDSNILTSNIIGVSVIPSIASGHQLTPYTSQVFVRVGTTLQQEAIVYLHDGRGTGADSCQVGGYKYSLCVVVRA